MESRYTGRVARYAATAIITVMLAGSAMAAATYTIKWGGNLNDVSKRTGVPVATLAALNGIKDATAKMPAGRVIKLGADNAAPAAAKPKTLPSRGAGTMREVIAERRYLAEKAGKAVKPAPAKPAIAKPAPAKPTHAPVATPAKPAPVAAPVAANTRGEQLVAAAREWMGTPYHFGGLDRNGIDCSGLVVVAARKLGITVPHRAADLFTMGTKVTYAGLQPGDLVFFITGGDGVSHVGIYIGNDHFIHASSKYGVKEQKIAGYYAEHLCGARRVIQ